MGDAEVGLVYRPSENVKTFARATRFHRSPFCDEMNYTLDGELLEPETGYSADLGAEWDVTDEFALDVEAGTQWMTPADERFDAAFMAAARKVLGEEACEGLDGWYGSLADEDGDKVFLHTVYDFAGAGEQVAFDVFRFDSDGLIAEHWDNLAAKANPNPSGRTQVDGQVEATDLEATEANRELVRGFLADVMQGQRPERTPEYFDGDAYLQHNTQIADGLSGLGAALAAMAEQGVSMVYDTVHMVLAQGDMVLAVSEGTFGGAPTSYYDLWRVEDGKIAEHWDVMETIADRETWANDNGKF